VFVRALTKKTLELHHGVEIRKKCLVQLHISHHPMISRAYMSEEYKSKISSFLACLLLLLLLPPAASHVVGLSPRRAPHRGVAGGSAGAANRAEAAAASRVAMQRRARATYVCLPWEEAKAHWSFDARQFRTPFSNSRARPARGERERGGISNSDQGVLSMGERVEGGRPRGTWMRLWSLWRAQYREEIREEG
jgi:hypothetical protein